MEEQMDILIEHSGVAHDENPPGRGSGRWPWGSGDKPFQRPRDFLQRTALLPLHRRMLHIPGCFRGTQ